MTTFQTLLEESVSRQGHLCIGQVIGVRMAMLGCSLVSIETPKNSRFRKKLLVYVEIDRCTADAIACVTGCQLGKRTMKFKDYGINAATFVNLDTATAFRLVSTENSRKHAHKYAPQEVTLKQQQLIGYQNMPDDLLFDVQRVEIDLSETDLSDSTRQHVVCSLCGQSVRDGKQVQLGKEIICQPCSDGSYFKTVAPYWISEIKSDLLEESIS